MNACYCCACRNMGFKKPQVSDKAVYHGSESYLICIVLTMTS